MHHAFRRTAVATAVTVLAGLAVPLTAASALAATPTETQFFVSDTDGDGFWGLYKRATPTGAKTLLIGDTDNGVTDLEGVVASQDGSRFLDTETTYDANVNPVRQRLALYDVSGRRARVVQDVDANGHSLVAPALSPTGGTVVWSDIDYSTSTSALKSTPAGGGAVTTLGSNLYSPVFVDASTLLVQSGGTWYSMPAAGGTKTVVGAVPSSAYDLRVSPDGSKLAWSLDNNATADIQVASLSVSSGTVTVGAPTTVATGQYNNSPSFTRDGASVEFVRYDSNFTGSLFSAPVDGSATAGTAVDGTSVGDIYSQAIGTTDDGAAPGDPSNAPATLNGTSVTVRWSLPADSDLSGVLIERRLNGTPQKTGIYVPAPQTSFVDTGLTLSQVYQYVITSVDRSGNQGSLPAAHDVTTIQAKPFAYSPTSLRFTRTPFTVGFSAAPSNAFWTVQYRMNSGATWYPWVNGVPGGSRTFGSAATSGVNATTAYSGVTYQFRVTGTDAYGNSTPAVVSAATVVPFDQTKASFNAGTNYAVSSAWLGSYRLMKVAGNYAKVSLTGNQLTIIGTRCKACGVFYLYDGTKLIKSIDTYASTTVARAVLYTLSYSTVGTHTYTLKVRGTAGRPNVILDGFGMRR